MISLCVNFVAGKNTEWCAAKIDGGVVWLLEFIKSCAEYFSISKKKSITKKKILR